MELHQLNILFTYIYNSRTITRASGCNSGITFEFWSHKTTLTEPQRCNFGLTSGNMMNLRAIIAFALTKSSKKTKKEKIKNKQHKIKTPKKRKRRIIRNCYRLSNRKWSPRRLMTTTSISNITANLCRYHRVQLLEKIFNQFKEKIIITQRFDFLEGEVTQTSATFQPH